MKIQKKINQGGKTRSSIGRRTVRLNFKARRRSKLRRR